jgi:hypothetical protein
VPEDSEITTTLRPKAASGQADDCLFQARPHWQVRPGDSLPTAIHGQTCAGSAENGSARHGHVARAGGSATCWTAQAAESRKKRVVVCAQVCRGVSPEGEGFVSGVHLAAGLERASDELACEAAAGDQGRASRRRCCRAGSVEPAHRCRSRSAGVRRRRGRRCCGRARKRLCRDPLLAAFRAVSPAPHLLPRAG